MVEEDRLEQILTLHRLEPEVPCDIDECDAVALWYLRCHHGEYVILVCPRHRHQFDVLVALPRSRPVCPSGHVHPKPLPWRPI